VIGGIFAFLWWKGYVAQVANYVRETKEELRKCSWPTWDELKGSTMLVILCVLGLGIFTFVVDLIFNAMVRWIT
jgi:preprotein translocase subunit SecE